MFFQRRSVCRSPVESPSPDYLRRSCCKFLCLLPANARVRSQFLLLHPKPIANEVQKQSLAATPPIPRRAFFEAPPASTPRALSRCCTNTTVDPTKASSHPSPEPAPDRERNLSSDKPTAARAPP